MPLKIMCVCICATIHASAVAEEQAGGKKILLGDGKVSMQSPAAWQSKKPRTNIVDFEFAIPAIEGDKIDGRVTVMGAGGSIEANVGRWVGQFVQPDRTPTLKRTQREKIEIAGQQVHLVDITGNYRDQPRGPFGPTVKREKYRMLAAIIVTDKLGQYFVKAVGPRRTIAANEDAFKKMIKSLAVAKKKK